MLRHPSGNIGDDCLSPRIAPLVRLPGVGQVAVWGRPIRVSDRSERVRELEMALP